MTNEQEIPFMISAIECFADKTQLGRIKRRSWSFAVLMYEVSNECQIEPYNELLPLNMSTVKEHIEKGNRLSPHNLMPAECKALMKKCFNADPVKRPSMQETRDTFQPAVKRYFQRHKNVT